MNKFLQNLERKMHGRAVPHLTAVIISLYVVGYLLSAINPVITAYMNLNIYAVLHGQVWRLVTWIMIPPTSLDIFTIIMLLFYLSIGMSLERTWGDFRYNVYIFGGMIISIIAAFVSYFIFSALYPFPDAVGQMIGACFSTYYVCMSILLAYAATFPNATVLLMFVIPIRMKYLGWIYGAFIAYDCIRYIRAAVSSGDVLYLIYVVAVAASLVNFLIFWLSARNGGVHLTKREKEVRKEFRRNQRRGTYSYGGNPGDKVVDIRTPKHRCEICGRTEISNPELEFRYCSKCYGAHEYCMDHLHSHRHIGPGEKDTNPYPGS